MLQVRGGWHGGCSSPLSMRKVLWVLTALLFGCAVDEIGVSEAELTRAERDAIAARVRAQFPARQITPIPVKTIPGNKKRQDALVALGQALAFDKILSAPSTPPADGHRRRSAR